MKKHYIFALSLPETKVVLVSVVLLFATISAANAANIGYQLQWLLHRKVSNCLWRDGESSLSSLHINNLNFSLMPETMKNQSGKATLTFSHETGKTFNFDHDTSVEVILINGEPWFVAVDVCNALDLQNPSARVREHLDPNEYLTYEIRRAGQQRTVNIINESGFYALVFQGKKPNAKKFSRWVRKEVLPSIRKTGMYTTPQTAEKLFGRYICFMGVDDNLYLRSVLKAVREMIDDDMKGFYITSDCRLKNKIEAARTLFSDQMRDLKNHKITMKYA